MLADIGRTEIESLIDEWVLNERDRRLLKRRLIDGIKYESLAEEFDLSVRHVKQLVFNYLKVILSKKALKTP
jgi:DNA-directed RNA polymerase specialized sigma24 family protein